MRHSEFVVSNPVLEEADNRYQISTKVRGPDSVDEIWFRSTEPLNADAPFAAEAFLAPALYAAMKEGRTLRVEAPISARLLGNLGRFQRIFCQWYPDFRPVEILPEEVVEEAQIPPPPKDGGMGFFFTTGVDSFHTYLHHREELTHALYIYGLEPAMEDPVCRAHNSKHLKRATAEMGVELIELETNIPLFTERFCDFISHAHGGVLAVTARLFNDRFRKVILSSTYPLTGIIPFGSHPFTDPLWSGGGSEVIHYGSEANRYEKMLEIANDELAFSLLRVCWKNVEHSYNCCRCEKCLRSMVALRIAGLLDQCPRFPSPLDLSLLPDVRYSSEGTRIDWKWNFQALRDVDDPELAAAMTKLDEANRAAELTKQVAADGNLMLASPEWQQLAPKLRNKFLKNFKEGEPDWFKEQVMESFEDVREDAFDPMWNRHRKWLKQKFVDAERARRRKRLRSALRRIGIGRSSSS